MRQRKSPLDFLFPRTRQGVLTAFLSHADRSWYRSDLAKHLSVRPSSLQRELAGLVQAGVLTQRVEGNRSYFQADPACPFLPELRGLIEKTAGIAAQLGEALSPLRSKITVAFIFGSVARGRERSESDVDLMVVGELGLKDVAARLRIVEIRISRPVNAHTFSRKEFANKVHSKHHFLSAVMDREKTFVIGTADDLDEVVAGQQS